jgi:hypothetical protein
MRLHPNIQPYVDLLTALTLALFMLLFYLFPDGKFVPRWLGWAAAFLIGVLVLDPLVIQSEARGPSATTLVLIAGMGGAAFGIVSQIYRFREVSNPAQRQQTKWVMAGFLSMFAMAILWSIFVEIFPLDPGPTRLLFNFSLLLQHIFIGFFPISVFISIFRYRLWDIDLVIRRTLQYGLLTGLLVLAFFGGVATFQWILRTLTGRADSPFVTVLTTLGIAALFNPLRRRVQAFIDRRFYRATYDAEQTLAQFASTARDEVDVDRLTGELLSVVRGAVHPEHVSLWLREASPAKREDTSPSS